jgi:UDP-2,4-diacetamido-2,4,6-trideoxy-beta-L-altropyranose hydrolase
LKVAIRADASAAIGTGHVMRCRALAQALEERGAVTQFTEESRVEAADWLVVDSYRLDAAWESSMRQKAAKILAIDDLADRKHDCDLLLDQNFLPHAAGRYDSLVPERCRRLLGPRYALLRPEFSHFRKKLQARTGKIEKILVSLGGVDAKNETSNVIFLLKPLRLAVDVVVGAANPHANRIARECAEAGFAFHRQASNMAELMAAADFAVGAGGSTTWERCCLGLPTLQVAIAPNQEAPSRALAEAGLIFFSGKSVTAEALRDALSDPARLKDQSRRMRALVDGEGARRVAAALFASPRSEISLRDAKNADALLYFDWANDPEVRRQSFDNRPIAWEAHQAWFAKRLADAVLLVAEDEAGVPLGQVRFERQGAWRVNYSMAAEFRGVGLSAKMLGMAIAQLHKREPAALLQAQVKKENVVSRKVFGALGFKEVSATMFQLDR